MSETRGILLRELHERFLVIKNKYNQMEAIPRDFGTGEKLHLTEIQMVRVIGDSRAINITELASKRGVTKGAVSQKISKLVTKGLVQKMRSPDNGKEILVKLTAKGLKVYKAHDANYRRMIKRLIGIYEEVPVEGLEIAFEFSKEIELLLDDFISEAL